MFKIAVIFLTQVLHISKTTSATSISPPNSKNAPTKSIRSREVIVVTGNFSIDGELVNMAGYDVLESRWSTDYSKDLYLYGESNGVIWDVAVNRSNAAFNTMYVVGAFDTVSEASQIQYCSVGQWDGPGGVGFEKVGEGLCPRGSDTSTTVQLDTIVLGSDGDIFVGGTFESRVWDGRHFVRILHVAHFDSVKISWLPLRGGELKRSTKELPRVNTLAWDDSTGTLFLGGTFDMLEETPISSGLAMWTAETGIVSFPGGGLTQLTAGPAGAASTIAFEPITQSLFVSGDFQAIGLSPCANIAVWYRRLNEWTCLHDPARAIAPLTTMFLDNSMLYISGWAATTSDWFGSGTGRQYPYAIAALDIAGYMRERLADHDNDTPHQDNDDVNNDANGGNSSLAVNSSFPTNAPTIAPSNINGKLRQLLDSSKSFKHRDDGNQVHSQLHHRQLRAKSSDFSLPVKVYRRRIQAKGYNHSKYNYPRYVKLGNSSEVSSGIYQRSSPYINITETQSDAMILPIRISHPFSRNLKNMSPPSTSRDKAGPTASPITRLWHPRWVWLPGFKGGNGPVLKMARGRGPFGDSLFIVGAFNNFPSVVLWSDNLSADGQRMSALLSKQTLQGLVTNVVQIRVKFAESVKPTIDPELENDYTFFILISCVLVGVFLGLTVAFGCRASGNNYNKPGNDDLIESMSEGIPLKTLSGDYLSTTVDFKECFERAMKARHLPTHESLLVINPKEIVLSRIIGEGSFGRVWSGQWRNSSVAVKEFVFAQAAIVGGSIERNKLIEEIVGEAGIMACLRHPKILQLYGCSLTMQAIWIVSELCIRGSLRAILNDEKIELSTLRKLSICLDVADGMMYLHTRSPPIIHRDLKSQNIFITEPSPNHFIAKIGDWGSARAVALSGAKSMTHGVGTACWLAPEVINYAHFSKDSDVYAFGIVLWEIFSRLEVYEGYSAAQIISKVAHEGLRPRIQPGSLCGALMAQCWSQNPSERPGFHRILKVLSRFYSEAKSSSNQSHSSGSSLKKGREPGWDDSEEGDVQGITIENLDAHNRQQQAERMQIAARNKPYNSLDSSHFFKTGINQIVEGISDPSKMNIPPRHSSQAGSVTKRFFLDDALEASPDQYLRVPTKPLTRALSDPVEVGVRTGEAFQSEDADESVSVRVQRVRNKQHRERERGKSESRSVGIRLGAGNGRQSTPKNDESAAHASDYSSIAGVADSRNHASDLVMWDGDSPMKLCYNGEGGEVEENAGSSKTVVTNSSQGFHQYSNKKQYSGSGRSIADPLRVAIISSSSDLNRMVALICADGHRVETLAEGNMAVPRLMLRREGDRRGGPADLVIIDLTDPSSGGLATVKRIRSHEMELEAQRLHRGLRNERAEVRQQRVRMAVLAEGSQSAIAGAVMNAGGDAVLQAPFTIESFRHVLSHLRISPNRQIFKDKSSTPRSGTPSSKAYGSPARISPPSRQAAASISPSDMTPNLNFPIFEFNSTYARPVKDYNDDYISEDLDDGNGGDEGGATFRLGQDLPEVNRDIEDDDPSPRHRSSTSQYSFVRDFS